MTRFSPNQIYKVVKTADNRFEKKEYKKSLDGYKKAISMRPNKDIESHCYFKMGLSHQFLENYSDAMAAFDKSLSIQKTFLGYFYRGILHMSLQQFKEAEDDFKHSLKTNTNDANAVLSYVNLGRVYLMQNKIKDAFKVLKSALDIKEDINALLLLAEAYKEDKDSESAKQTYERILKISNNRDAIIGLGSFYLESHEEQKAISLLKNYLQDHQDPELLKIKGEIHFSLNDYENALTNFKKARKLTNTESLLIREARCLLSLQRPDDAVEIVQEYISHNKKSILPKIFLAEMEATNNHSEKASEILNELIQTEPTVQTNPELSLTVANALLLNNEYDKAETSFLNAMKLGVKSWNLMKQLTIISIERQEYETGLIRTDKLLQLAENASEIGHSYHLKAIIYFKQQKYQDTVKVTDEGLNELKKTKNEQYFVLSLLQIKAKMKLDLKSESEMQVQSLVSENPQIRSLIEADSELKAFLN